MLKVKPNIRIKMSSFAFVFLETIMQKDNEQTEAFNPQVTTDRLTAAKAYEEAALLNNNYEENIEDEQNFNTFL